MKKTLAKIAPMLAAFIAFGFASCDKPEPAPVAVDGTALLKEIQKKSDREIAKLKGQVDKLTAENAELQSKYDSAIRLVARMGSTSAPSSPRPVAPREMTSDEKLAAYEANGIQDVPKDISDKIIAGAKSQYGNSSGLTAAMIQREAESYFTVIDFQAKVGTMPITVRDAIAAEAKRENANSWSGMANQIKRSSDSWATVTEWSKSGVPGLDAARSKAVIDDALKQYPNDWNMAVFQIGLLAKRPQ